MERIYGGKVNKDSAALFWHGTGARGYRHSKHSAGAFMQSADIDKLYFLSW